MKRIMIMMIVLGFVVMAQAQNKVIQPKPSRTVIVTAPVYPAFAMGFGFGYSPFYRPYYDPFYNPYYRHRINQRMPSELQLSLDEVANEYDYKIATVRNDKSLKGKERRQAIRALRYEKEGALIDAKRNFIKRDQQKDLP